MKYPTIKSIMMNSKININNKRVPLSDDGLIVQSKYFDYCPVKKLKRYRSAFTTEQINYLEKEFKKFPYIGSANRKEVANILKISERAIKIWFQNRRMKEKREVGNKETNVDNKTNINTPLYKEKVKDLNNATKVIDNVQQVFKNDRMRIKNLEISKCETNKSSIRIDKNTKTIAPKSNPNIKKPMVSSTIRNICRIPPQQSTVQKKDFNHLSHTREQPLKQRSNPLPFQRQKTTETAQDLSFSRNKAQPQFYPTQSHINPRIPAHYCSPQPASMNTGNVLWKPVSILPMMPGMASSIIGHYPGFPLNNQEITKGACLCQVSGLPHAVNEQVQCSRLQPQYLLAIPLSNSIQKM